ncbi:ribonuclease H-like domain-containing protein [Russula brevipes]|nr:ribonuclease H-like domain-containing protein [Russula brevipes]
MPRAGYYAVKIGRRPGIYTTWEDCREQVDGYPCAKYKKLRTVEEAEAWVQGSASQSRSMEQRGVPYPVQSKIKPANGSLVQARPPTTSKLGGQVPMSSSTSTPVTPAQTVQPEPESQFTTGPSSARSRAKEGPSRTARVEDVVYTDGACSGNGQPGSVAGIGVWWGPNDPRNLCERCPGRQTNNRAELIAIIRALETTPITSVPLVIKSDSEYAIKCFSVWLPGWRRNNFTTSSGMPVKNVKLIMYMSVLFSTRERSGQQVRLQHVRGHAGEVGNEGADTLAVRGAKLKDVEEPDWDALRLEVEEKPVRSAHASVKLTDLSVSNS